MGTRNESPSRGMRGCGGSQSKQGITLTCHPQNLLESEGIRPTVTHVQQIFYRKEGEKVCTYFSKRHVINPLEIIFLFGPFMKKDLIQLNLWPRYGLISRRKNNN